MTTDMSALRSYLLCEHQNSVCADRLDAITRIVTGLTESDVDGSFVEVGCYKGAMALWLRALLDGSPLASRAVHVYDSFMGLPEPGDSDSDYLSAGELTAAPEEVITLHAAWEREAPTIHAGWFRDTLPTQLPDQIAFAYLDGDLYDSIMDGLTYCVPRLAPGGILVVDDYADLAVNPRAWNGLPGVKRACDDYFGREGAMEVIIGDGDLAFGLYRAP